MVWDCAHGLRIGCAVTFDTLFAGCNPSKEPFRSRISQMASRRYEMEDAVPALEYEGEGVVRSITRGGESGVIHLDQRTVRKDSVQEYRQYGMPYQVIDSLKLVSSSDKGSHYSAYETCERGTLERFDSVARVPYSVKTFPAPQALPTTSPRAR